jgi:FAD/FMN-containing dehydrogenase
VTGLGIESTSFRNGLPHESVIEMDVLTGAGEVVTASLDGAHADLLRGFPNSYGTLGYATRLRVELEPVSPFVALRHVRFHSLEELVAAMDDIVERGSYDGAGVDYLDGVVFSATEAYLTLGAKTDEPGPVSDYTGTQVYYRSIQHDAATPRTDRLTTHDYLWRWDTDWFWCSRAFGAQHPLLRRVWPRRYRRSSFYWRLIALDHRYEIADRIEARKGRPPRERVVQDVEVPIDRCAEFLHWFLREIPIEPIWLCPLRVRKRAGGPAVGERPWPLYPLEAGRTYVNIGFWSSVPRDPSGEPGVANRLIEEEVSRLDGHKSLYSDAYYDEEEFWRRYGGSSYAALKGRYDPGSRLLDLYSKAVQRK